MCTSNQLKIERGEIRGRVARSRRRRGAVQSIELLLLLPVLVVLIFGCLELAFLFSANSRLKAASLAACRVAALPLDDAQEHRRQIRHAVEQVLERDHFVKAYELVLEIGRSAGDPVAVELRLPMKSATPDLLGPVFTLKGKELRARTVMRKE